MSTKPILIIFFNRFGKTISVSMFAAALLYSAPSVEISIYSTCKRISQKLLRNVMKFLSLVHEGLGVPEFKEVRCNMEELVLQGPGGASDIRIVYSYPSKVDRPIPPNLCGRLTQPAHAEAVSPHGTAPDSPTDWKCLTLSVRCSKVSSSLPALAKCFSR